MTKRFGELNCDEPITDAELNFKVNTFYACLDIMLQQINNRFLGLQEIYRRFEFLLPKNMIKINDQELFTSAKNLALIYSEDLSLADFPKQLMSFRNLLRSKIVTMEHLSIKKFCDVIIKDHQTILSSIPEILTVFRLFLTLPVTVASAERSFSKLKLIKNYLRNSISEERLSSLAVLSIEQEIARDLDVQLIVEEFSAKNARRALRFQNPGPE